MLTTKRLTFVLLAISWAVTLGCEVDTLGPRTQSNGSNESKPSTAKWLSLSGRVTSSETGEPVVGARITLYRLMPADRADSAIATVETSETGSYVLNFSHRCDGSSYYLRVRKDGYPNLYVMRGLPDDACTRTRWVIDIQIAGLA